MRFEDLDAWKRARELVRALYALTRKGVLARDYALSGQIQRAGVSIMSNVSEGFERMHLAEKLQFYNIARGPSAEVRSLLYVIEDNFPEKVETAILLRKETAAVGELTTGLIRSTERRKKASGLRSLLALIF